MTYRKKGGAEPVAIVGISFRFPGDLCDERGFWQALKEGRDVVTEIGPERWATNELQHPERSEPGRSITYSAGVLSRIDEFDAAFFGISPREAAWLDPQQRMLLELAWEAMENGGQVLSQLAGSDCAVFVGISGLDYGVRGISDLASLSAHSMTGNTLSIAANRLSYAFDLRGPSMSVDTACSSSLVALHQACATLRRGESSIALVASAHLLLHPYPFIGFTKASMLSAGGRCRTFDAAADGYVRAEGGAVLVLKPLAQAEKDGDTIHAVILASGTNADGGDKSGLTIPSSNGQKELMRSVLKQAGIAPGQVDYIEAHGTGTPVGDPIEASAIGEIYGRGRTSPLPIGSVKTNLGHLEPTSGMAGLIKTVLMLKHRELPPSLHFVNPNPYIKFDELNLHVVTQHTPLPKMGKRAPIMGVNSFGFGGANAHVLLQAHRPAKKTATATATHPPLFLSARTPDALRALAGRYADFLRAPDAPPYYDTAYCAAFRRQHLEHRLALTASDPLVLARFAQGENPPEIMTETLPADPGPVAFIYSGNGSQWVGMGQRLLAESARFAQLMDELDTAMKTRAGFSILAMLAADEATSRMDDTGVAQPLLFAMQVAITRMLREQGIEAQAVAGHSVGEVAAAWAAGTLTLDQAIDVICARSSAQALTRGEGRMAAVGISEEAMRGILSEGNHPTIEIAGINSASNITLAGSLAELESLQKMFDARNIFFRLLDLDYAFHSKSMDAIRPRIEQQLSGLAPTVSTIDFISTVTGEALGGTELTSGYWWDNVREPVRFARAIEMLAARGCRVFLEIGPHAILQRYMTECLATAHIAGRVLPTLRRGDDGVARLSEAMLCVQLSLPTPQLQPYFPVAGQFVQLPNYPWQRERYWLADTSEGYAIIERRRIHPLLGWRLKENEASWENTLDTAIYSYLADHCIAEAVVFPASGYVEMALAASREWFGGGHFELEEMDILFPIVFDEEHARSMRFEFTPREGTFRILSRQRLSDDAWSINAVGRLLGAPTRQAPDMSHGMRGTAVDAATHYHLAHLLGLEYGAAFQAFTDASVQGDTLEGRIHLPEGLQENSADYLLHPVLLDACFQSLVHFFRSDIEAGKGLPLLPVKVGRLRYFSSAPATQFRVKLTQSGARSVQADFILMDEKGDTVCALEGCRFRAASVQRKAQAAPAHWRIDAKLAPLPIDSHIIDMGGNETWAAQAREWHADFEPLLRRQDYFHDGVPLFDALIVSFAYAAFRELNARDDTWMQQALQSPDAIPAERRMFFLWLARRLQDAALLKETDGAWHFEEDSVPPPAEDIWRTLLSEFPDAFPELVFVGRIGRRLAALLSGEQDTQDLLRNIQRSHLLESLFDEALPYRGINLALREILQSIGSAWPENRRLRILEISGGSSELPYHLSTHLPDDRVDYVIAEVENERLARLKAEYQSHPFVTVATLGANDLALTAEAKLPIEFDIVIVHHWLHRAPNSAMALSVLRRQLAQGGKLILAERHPCYAADFVFGLDPQWWRDENNQASSLLGPDAWGMLLKSQGFDDIETVIEPTDQETRGGAYLMLARNIAISADAPELPPANWLLLCDSAQPDHHLDERLALRLTSHGQHVTLARTGANADEKTLCALLAKMQQERGRIDHVVYLAGMEGEIAAPETTMENTRCHAALHLVQALAHGEAGQPKLWLVTSGGALVTQAASDWHTNPLEASLWGLGRVIMNEYPALECTLIDIAFDPKIADAAERLQNELLAPDGENEIVLAPQARFGLRMQRDAAAIPAAQSAPRFRLDFQVPGQLRNLLWLPQEERALGEDEIEVRPAAAGLNFRDVMYAMGLLPDEAVENGFAGASLGLEFAGTVCRVGARVSEYRVGDEVMGFAPACFSSHVVTSANAVARKPDTWSFAQAATVPTAFFTVYYALKHLANLQPGERVLIHGAAGGVGIAAIQVAQYLGAEIFATAGSEEKRDFVHLLGADHVLDSRSLAFADDVLALTNGEGVDVVLNSLAGEAINRNLRALKPFGRFLELGKRDFFENTHIGLRPFKNNISYFGIDADQLLIGRPQLAARLFREVMELFRDGELTPLPYRVFPADRIVEAFRHMQQSRHIGKVVVDLADARVPMAQQKQAQQPLHFSGDATYLVTGGLTGFGLESACWLAEHGAGHLVLLSRRGMDTPDAVAAVARLEALGARVHVFACDITDHSSLETIFSRIAQELPSLRGILHAAMVLDDSLMQNLTAERMDAVLAPKLLGAWHLHSLSFSLPLDHFILYSSVTTSIGNPGQANYVAANAYLEALAAWRREHGLPATCIGWGPIGDAGYLARNAAVKDSLAARLGAKPLTSRQALSQLGQLLTENRSQVTVADFEWTALARLLPSAAGPRFETLRKSSESSDSGADNTTDFLLLIAGKSTDEIRQIVQALIITEVAKILCIGIERIDPARSLSDLGMDSLMAVELAVAVEQRFGVSLPAMALSEGSGSVERISARLAEKLSGGAQEEQGDRLTTLVNTMASQHAENMSAEEVSQVLEENARQAQAGVRLIA